MTNQKGGSQASNRVMALLPEQCNIKNLGTISPVHKDNIAGMNFYQTTGGGVSKRSRRSRRRRRSISRSNRKNKGRKRSIRSRRNSRRRNRRY